MKKDDIIGQKLFETCTLNQYYLNLISKATAEDDESPILLAAAYRQKLYAIVERYDRMLESAKQREKLCLTLDPSSMSSKLSNLNQQNLKASITASSSSLTRTSTPNKCYSTANTPAPTPTSYQKYPTITPSQSSNSSFLKSSISNYTISSNHQKLTKTNSTSTLATITSASNKNLSKINNNNSTNNHSTNLNQTRLAQRLEAIYYYESSSSEEEVEDDLDDVEDEIEEEDYYNNYSKINSTTNQLGLNLEQSSKSMNRLNSKNNNHPQALSSDTSLLCSIKTITETMSTRLDRLKTNLNDSTQSDYSNITNVTSLDHTSSIGTPTVSMTSSSSTTTSSCCGEKLSSNISKDSGVFGDLTSDFSTSSNPKLTMKTLVDQQLNNGDLITKNVDDNINCSKNGDLSSGYDDGSIGNDDNNSTSPSSSSNSSSSSNDQDEEEIEEEEEYTESYEINEYTLNKINNQNNVSQTNRSLVWSQMPNRNELNQNKGARIVKGFTANQLRLNNNVNTNGSSLKEQFLQKKLTQQENGEHNTNSRNKFSTIILKKSQNNNNNTNHDSFGKTANNRLMNLELDLNDLENTNMMSMMMSANNSVLMKNNNENMISSSSSTPSPSSSTISSSSSSNNSHNETINQNDDSHLQLNSSPETTPSNLDAKQSQFFFNSYNSLMNVSMLDNIQATNTNLEYDNMNTSILTFN